MDNIKAMLASSDKDNLYMAVNILRIKNDKISIKLLKKVSLFDRVRNYSDVCEELGIKELTEENFNFLPIEERQKQLGYHKITNIEKLFNGKWVKNWGNTSQNKYYPYFTKDDRSGYLVFDGSVSNGSFATGMVAVFKDEETSTFVGKLFIDIYNVLLK